MTYRHALELALVLGKYSTTLCTSGERGVSIVVTVLGEMTTLTQKSENVNFRYIDTDILGKESNINGTAPKLTP